MITVGLDVDSLDRYPCGTKSYVRGLAYSLTTQCKETLSIREVRAPEDLLGCDIYHAQHNLRLSPPTTCKTVVTVHDTLILDSPQHYAKQDTVEACRRLSGLLADTRVAVCWTNSQALRTRPLQFIVPPSYEGVFALPLPKPIIMVARDEPRKNWDLAIQAYVELRNLLPRGWCPHMTIVGYTNRRTTPRGITIVDNMSDDNLARLVGGAQLVISTSIAEGFGMVPLLAQAMGVHTICLEASTVLRGQGITVLPNTVSPAYFGSTMFHFVKSTGFNYPYDAPTQARAQMACYNTLMGNI